MCSKNFLILILCTVCLKFSSGQHNIAPAHVRTKWALSPSIKYDAFCLINTLMGEQFYINYYPRVFKHYDSLLTPVARNSLNELRQYKNKRGIILSAFLCNIFYQLPDSSLAEVLQKINDKSRMKKLLTSDNYAAVSDIQKELSTVLEFLLENGFEKNYNREVIPAINTRITVLLPLVNKYNIVYNIEKTVGLPLSTDSIRFYLMRYSSPHGISINNTTFLSEYTYDVSITLKVAIHEMMHPYFNSFPSDVKKAIKGLKKDSLIYNAFLNHDKSFGYNDFEGYIAESCVRALEQVISSQLGLGTGENNHWKTEDKGMHVFGAILIQKMKSGGFPEHFDGNFMQLLLGTIEEVNKKGGKYLYDKLYN